MSTSDERYSSEPTQHFRAAGADQLDRPVDGPDMLDEFEDDLDDQLPPTRWHAGLDIGLLLIRVAIGGTMLLAGLWKFGMFDSGFSVNLMADSLQSQGFSSPELLAWVLMLTEVGGGAALILGLATPLAAAGALGVTASATYLTKDIGYFGQILDGGGTVPGYQLPLLVAALSLGLLFTGPGRISMDVPFPWRKKPLPYGVFGLLLAAAASVVVLTLFR